MTQWVKGRGPCHQAQWLEFKSRHTHGRGWKWLSQVVLRSPHMHCYMCITPNTQSHRTKHLKWQGWGSGPVLACMCNTVGLIVDATENNKVKIKKKTSLFSGWKRVMWWAQSPPNSSLSYLTEPGSGSANFLEMCYFSNVCILNTFQAVYQLCCWLHHCGPW